MKREDIEKRISEIRRVMREEKVDLYLMTNSDFHMTEYPGDYFKGIEYVSGFTGSEAKMAITQDNAHLWTDPRYTVTAEEELVGTCITPHIYGDPDDSISTLSDFFEASGDAILEDLIDEFGEDQEMKKYTIGFDGRMFTYKSLEDLIDSLSPGYESGKIILDPHADLVGEIWEDRPALPMGHVYVLGDEYTGESTASKLTRVRSVLSDISESAGTVITMLDDVAWLFNIRGDDIAYSTVTMAYAYVDQDEAVIFIDGRKLDDDAKKYFAENDVEVREYSEFYSFLEKMPRDVAVIDEKLNNAAVIMTLASRDEITLYQKDRLIQDLRALKNQTEIRCEIDAQKRDAVAVIRFLKWIDDNFGKIKITELSAAAKLHEFRKEQGALDESFETISAYGPHAAIIHYTPTEETDAELEPGNFLLVDSGAHYMGGTTDVTRTIPLGEVSEEMKKDYTLALASMLELVKARVPAGISDRELDVIARRPLWDHGRDFMHSTGHGVGVMLNVHEAPQNISYLHKDEIEMKPGMITSDEPGLYVEGKYGIRHEIEIMCVCDRQNSRFIRFAPITYVPIDTSAVDRKFLEPAEAMTLNAYNQIVFKKMKDLLEPDDMRWLRMKTMPI